MDYTMRPFHPLRARRQLEDPTSLTHEPGSALEEHKDTLCFATGALENPQDKQAGRTTGRLREPAQALKRLAYKTARHAP